MILKLVFLLAFLATIAINIVCVNEISKYSKDYKKSLISSTIWSIPAILGNCVILFSNNELVLTIAYSIFYLSLDWILFYLLEFTCKYSKYEIKNNIFVWILKTLLLLDSISLGLNVFFHHAFTLDMQTHRTIFLVPYQIHLGLSYLLSGLIVVLLFYRLLKSPKIYRPKYILVLFIFLIDLIADGIYIISGINIDFSIIFMALSCVIISYSAFIYSPKSLLNRSLTMIVGNMDDPIIFFNEDNECIYQNSAFENFMTNYKRKGFDPEKPFTVWKNSRNLQSKEFSDFSDQRFTQEIEHDGRTYSFNIWYHNLKDEAGFFLGTFFQIHDKTKELERDSLQKYLSAHDKLTGLYNKETFYEKVEEYVKFNPNPNYVMICSDVENFKLVNDVFGKTAADKFLERIAKSMKKSITTTELFGRIGGDRFALLLEKQYFNEEVFIQKVNELSHIDGNDYYPIIFHIGIYELDDLTIPASVMCDRALMAINSVRGSVQEIISYYTDKMREDALRDQKYTGEFKEALSDGQFVFYLQPQISVNNSCEGAEALARWIHPEDGIVNPEDFISLFERNGIISELDTYIWEEAAKKLREWKDLGKDEFYISVNISPKDMCYLNIFEVFTDLVERYQINPANLHLEITESAFLMNIDSQIELIDKLRKYGFIVEMDDFGSGYSSLNMLKNVHFDVIKIDMEFLKETMDEKRKKIILKNIIKLSKELNMPVVVEGIEKPEQRDFLADAGCDLFQGFFYDKPLTVQDFEKKYLDLE